MAQAEPTSIQASEVNPLLSPECRDFVKACHVLITEHEDKFSAMEYVAVVLAGDELELQ